MPTIFFNPPELTKSNVENPDATLSILRLRPSAQVSENFVELSWLGPIYGYLGALRRLHLRWRLVGSSSRWLLYTPDSPLGNEAAVQGFHIGGGYSEVRCLGWLEVDGSISLSKVDKA